MSSDMLILVNPQASGGSNAALWPEMERELRESCEQYHPEIIFTTAGDFGSKMTRTALKSGIKNLLVVGGDGTISEVVQGFFENGRVIVPDAVLRIMPSGRGNDFLRSLTTERVIKSKSVWKEAMAILKSGSPKPTDVGLMTCGESSRYFINIASFGCGGLVLDRVLKLKSKRAWTYLLETALATMEYKPVHLAIEVDGKLIHDGPVFFGYVMNGQFNGGGMHWSLDAKLDDGLFDVFIAEPVGFVKRLWGSRRMWTGNWKDEPSVKIHQGKKVSIEARSEWPGHPIFELDGDQPEFLKSATSARFEIFPGAIQIWR